MRIALAQLRSGPDPQRNLGLLRQTVAEATRQGAQLVVAPEGTMANLAVDPRTIAESLDGPFASGVRQLARECGVVVVVGMFTTGSDGRARNTLLVTDGTGLDEHYDKIHLFDALGARESARVEPGERLVTVAVASSTIGLATCYDVRFADQFTALGRAGAEIICLPASWADGDAKLDQWRLLARSRAMDAQAVLVAVDQPLTTGKGALGVGHSMVVGPLGEVLAEAGDDPELLVVDVDLGQVARARESVPVLAHLPVPGRRDEAAN